MLFVVFVAYSFGTAMKGISHDCHDCFLGRLSQHRYTTGAEPIQQLVAAEGLSLLLCPSLSGLTSLPELASVLILTCR